MSCKKCKGNCGCNEQPITIPTITKEYPEPCSEIFYDACIMHGQADMYINIGDEKIEVSKGERLDSIIQKIMVYIANGQGFSSAAYNFKIAEYTNDSVTLTWQGTGEYTLHIDKSHATDSDNEEEIDVTGLFRYTVTCLSGGEYEFYLEEQTENTKSVTLKIKL